MGKVSIPSIVQSKPPPALVVCFEQGGLATDAAPVVSRLTAEMLEAESADLDDPSGLDDDDDELDVNEIAIDNVD